jgi:hypothetical protein
MGMAGFYDKNPSPVSPEGEKPRPPAADVRASGQDRSRIHAISFRRGQTDIPINHTNQGEGPHLLFSRPFGVEILHNKKLRGTSEFLFILSSDW